MKKIVAFLILTFNFISFNVFSQSNSVIPNDSTLYNVNDSTRYFTCVRSPGIRITYPNVVMNLPILDAPFNYQKGFYVPSMNQALGLSASFHKISLYGIDAGIDRAINPEKKFWNHFTKGVSYLGFALLSSYIPLGNSWLHEEYHRAVMHNRNVKSFNDVYNFPFFSSTIAVSHVNDVDLIRMKNNYNSDFVRMHAAGIEGEYELVLALQKSNFFSFEPRDYQFIYWLNILQPIYYINMCTTKEADDLTDEMNKQDGTNIEKRDFTGLDFTAWTYDLFRPNQHYEARGIHPSGVGINRYIKHSDLTSEEQKYLRLQSRLSFLSLVDLTLFSSKNIYFNIGSERVKFNFNIKHYLTSFGSSTNLNLFIKTYTKGFFISILTQFNQQSYFPGIDVMFSGYTLYIGHKPFFIGSRVMLWSQPKDQSFETSKHDLGGLIGVNASCRLYKSLSIYATIEAKTNGWVASNPYLDKNITSRIGIYWSLFYKTIGK